MGSRLASRATLWVAFVLMAASVAGATTFNVQVGPGTTFSPSTVNISVGDSVRWTNSGGFHNVRADNDSFRCANGCDGSGGDGSPSTSAWSAVVTFNTAGTFRYYCEIHGAPGGGGMSGMVVVGQGPPPPPPPLPGQLRFSNNSYNVNEGGGNATITVQRVGGDDGAVAVNFATQNASATAGLDYTAASGTLNWGDQDSSAKTFNVAILEDSLVEGSEGLNLRLSNPTGGATLATPNVASLVIADNDQAPPPGPCVDDANTLCLEQNRFKLQIAWRTAPPQSQQGQGLRQTIRDFSGAFSFFNPDNLEMLVKVIDACALNNRFWVFFAATTNVEFTLTVTDTDHPEVPPKTYFNPLNTAAVPVQDTNAFATCP
ncbi:MAG: Calx-beta domain-containing protein [Thermoanaerobaculia bacterium]